MVLAFELAVSNLLCYLMVYLHFMCSFMSVVQFDEKERKKQSCGSLPTTHLVPTIK